jgi:hypothetical protein
MEICPLLTGLRASPPTVHAQLTLLTVSEKKFAHFTPSEIEVSEHFVVVGDGEGSHFMHLLPNALHLTLQASYLPCRGCHFELKQLGFTAAYRARQCLLTSRYTFISIFRAWLLQPHRSESGTWHNRYLIRKHACADASPCMRQQIQIRRVE